MYSTLKGGTIVKNTVLVLNHPGALAPGAIIIAKTNTIVLGSVS